MSSLPPSDLLPTRLNLSVARRCFVSCPGCYSLFGAGEVDVQALLRSVRVFVRLGVDAVTLSGGDPLTIANLDALLDGLREARVRAIKLDTVGTSLLLDAKTLSREADTVRRREAAALIGKLDQVAIPLDGASNESVARFRKGRAGLYDETLNILETLDSLPARIMINTVAHAHNATEFPAIADALARFKRIELWNVFQYTPTDLAQAKANTHFELSATAFDALERETQALLSARALRAAFWSRRARLGAYLLINSDGEAWMPDADGRTVHLGALYGRETEVLEAWRARAAQLSEGAAA